MKKGLKIFIFGLVGIIAILLIVNLFLPSETKMERKIEINTTSALAFALLNDPGRMNEWSPWSKIDTANTKYEFFETRTGVGSGYKWSNPSNDSVGVGSLEITKSEGDSLIEWKLVFEGQGEAKAWHKISEKEGKTTVTWGFHSQIPFPFRLFMVFVDMEDYIGKDYDKGLSQLKALLEAVPPKPEPSMTDPQVKDVAGKPMISMRTKATVAEIEGKMGEMYTALIGYATANKGEMDGMPMTVWHVWDKEAGTCEFEAIIPIKKKIKGKGDIKAGMTPKGKMVSCVFTGAYDKSGMADDALSAYIEANAMKKAGPPCWLYINDPGTVAGPEEYQTEIMIPVSE